MRREKKGKVVETAWVESKEWLETLRGILKKNQRLFRALAFNDSSLLNKPITKKERKEYSNAIDKAIDEDIKKTGKDKRKKY